MGAEVSWWKTLLIEMCKLWKIQNEIHSKEKRRDGEETHARAGLD
jgi:hypothetical protein